MKTIKTLLSIALFGIVANVNAQEARIKSETRISSSNEKIAYYEQRGAEDAQYELKFKAKSKSDEQSFWYEQKQYEKELKKDNKRAYRAYIQSKQEAYAQHHSHCDGHCHHSDSFYQYAGFYHYEYDRRNYERSPSNTSVKTQIGVRTPSVRLGVF